MSSLTGFTVATFLYLAHKDGYAFADADLERAFTAIDAEGANESTGQSLLAVVESALGDASPDAVTVALKGWLGDAIIADGIQATDRESRISAIRRARFGRSTPALAWILERSDAGELVNTLVLIEAFDAEVTAMDPNPFNDIDEARTFPLHDFMARWELAGCRSIRLN